MSHTACLLQKLSQRRPRAHILIACGTQRGGANSDALAKFQFRDVGLLLVILIGNVHHFPFFLLISVRTTLVCFFVPPQIFEILVCIIRAKFIAFSCCTRVEISVSLMSKCPSIGGWILVMLSRLAGPSFGRSWGMCTGPRLPTVRCELKPISPPFLQHVEKMLLGFQQSGKAGVLQL